jgi:hypothetical protein
VRTVIAPLHPEVQKELRALDHRRADIARVTSGGWPWSPTSARASSGGCYRTTGAGGSTSIATTAPTTCSAPGVRRSDAATRTSAKDLNGESSTDADT